MTDKESPRYHRIRKNFGYNVRFFRECSGMSLTELGKESCYDKSYLSRIENATANPSLEAIVRIAEALGVTTPGIFLDGEFPTKK